MAGILFSSLEWDEIKELIRVTVDEATRNIGLKDQDDSERLLKIEEVSEIFGVSINTVHDWKKKGKIPFYRIGSRIFFKRSEIIRSLKKIS